VIKIGVTPILSLGVFALQKLRLNYIRSRPSLMVSRISSIEILAFIPFIFANGDLFFPLY